MTLTIAYHVAILLLPLLLSRDVFSYAYYGRILSRYGGNPYVSTPADYPANDLFRFMWPDWRDTPSVYGPVFVWHRGRDHRGVPRRIVDVIVAFRAVAVAASLGSVWFVVKTRRPGASVQDGVRRRDDRAEPRRCCSTPWAAVTSTCW